MVFWRQPTLGNLAGAAAARHRLSSFGARFAQGAPAPGPAGPPTVPVSVATVTRKDVPDYLRGLGTVLALQTVQLRSQVDGVLLSVPVTEGQEVRQATCSP